MKYVHRPMTGRLLALVLLACPSMAADSEPRAEVMTPLLLGVQDAPIPFLGSDRQIHLVYELWITNFSAGEAVVETVAVVGDDKILETLDGAAVANRLQPAGRRDTSATVAPSTQALLFLHVVLPADAAIPRLLSHRISVRVAAAPPGQEEMRERGGETPAATPAPPFRSTGGCTWHSVSRSIGNSSTPKVASMLVRRASLPTIRSTAAMCLRWLTHRWSR